MIIKYRIFGKKKEWNEERKRKGEGEKK